MQNFVGYISRDKSFKGIVLQQQLLSIRIANTYKFEPFLWSQLRRALLTERKNASNTNSELFSRDIHDQCDQIKIAKCL